MMLLIEYLEEAARYLKARNEAKRRLEEDRPTVTDHLEKRMTGDNNILVYKFRAITKEGEIVSENEGCLSVPEFRADVKRAASITVEGYDREGKPVKIDAEGMLAIVLQHEIDHLNGTLFLDHISLLKRQMYSRRIKKKMKMK